MIIKFTAEGFDIEDLPIVAGNPLVVPLPVAKPPLTFVGPIKISVPTTSMEVLWDASSKPNSGYLR